MGGHRRVRRVTVASAITAPSPAYVVSDLRPERVEAIGPLDDADTGPLHWVYVLRLKHDGFKRRGKPRWEFRLTCSAAQRLREGWIVSGECDDREFVVRGRATASGLKLIQPEMAKLEPREYEMLETLLAVAIDAWTRRHGA